MGQARCNIKPFTAPVILHKTKHIRYVFCRYVKRLHKSKGDNNLEGSEQLETIDFIAEFTFSCKLGYFHFYGCSHNPFKPGVFCCALKTDISAIESVRCRSPPSVLVFQKIKTEVSI